MPVGAKKPAIKALYYITHVSNLPSILREGILSHAAVERLGLTYTPIYDEQIVGRRRRRNVQAGGTLWDYGNLYFQPRNPMMYRVVCEKGVDELAVVAVSPKALSTPAALISLGNAASWESQIVPAKEGLKALANLWRIINSEWWNPHDGSKRTIMAECLIPERIPPDLILTIYVAKHDAADTLRSQIAQRVQVVPEPHMFFRPLRRIPILPRLSLVEGDMFFSTMHTLTISVNTVGVMGKGLASRTKYQLPDVYVAYQDACRSRKLKMGRPILYRRESFLYEELADEPASLPQPNANKWFLFFATKRHWRDKSDPSGIEKGLQWLEENYKREGIKSLAIPALGCGLGRLEWRDVGPIMCKYLANIDIQAAIYLPRERKISNEYLTREYLVPRGTGSTGSSARGVRSMEAV